MSESSKSPSSTRSVLGDISSRKQRFNTELTKLKNDSSNNPLFQQINTKTLFCQYNKPRRNVSPIEISVAEGAEKYYVQYNELFDFIQEAHVAIGHRGIINTMKELKKNLQILLSPSQDSTEEELLQKLDLPLLPDDAGDIVSPSDLNDTATIIDAAAIVEPVNPVNTLSNVEPYRTAAIETN
ncbi:unnamed protein product [Adineta ricciae]|uniref:Uncharacterized protein n=1 Tax=Adineta ricciae TaxID=249248 RepID=A0A815IZ76_ADIRI|nr:unnamed protein product [Adineta ricciae]